MDKKKRRIASFIIAFLCLFLYGNTLENDYALDDEYVMTNNPLVQKGVKGIPKIFRSPYVQKKNETHSYRPVTLTSFAIEYELFGAKPKTGHLINLMLYVITCLVLFKLLQRLFREYHWSLAAIATFLFLVLPVHSEVVNNIKCRDELLCFLFAILSLIQFVKYADTRKVMAFSLGVLFIIMSLLSKPSSMTFLVIIPLTLWFFTEIKLKSLGLILGGVVLGFIVVKFGASSVVIPETSEARETLYYENPFFEDNPGFIGRIPMAFYTIGYYVKLMVYPAVLICYYGYNQVPIVGWDSPLFWTSMILILAAIGWALYKIKTKAIWIYGILYFVIAISMFSNLLRPAVGIIAERFVYLPSLGFCILLSYLLFKLFNKSKEIGKFEGKYKVGIVVSLLVVFALSAAKITSRNTEWKNKDTLFFSDVEKAPNSAKLNALVGNHLFQKVQLEKRPQQKSQLIENAIFYYNRSVEVFPGYATSWNNMATLYFNGQRNFVKAEESYRKAAEIDPEYPEALFGIGYCLELKNENEKAISYFEKVLKFDPDFIRATEHINKIKALEK
ncbi:MAG: hypothetical protein ACJA1C_002828 [Crocinitomicaceae bacterium]|jgi:hypothetical protein